MRASQIRRIWDQHVRRHGCVETSCQEDCNGTIAGGKDDRKCDSRDDQESEYNITLNDWKQEHVLSCCHPRSKLVQTTRLIAQHRHQHLNESMKVSIVLHVLGLPFFSHGFHVPRRASLQRPRNCLLHLIPVRSMCNDTSFGEQGYRCLDKNGNFEDYSLCVVEEPDLVELSRLTVDVFGSDVVRIGSATTGSLETLLMTPAIELVNGYSAMVAFAEVLAGLRSRIRDRLLDNNLKRPNISNLSRDEQIKVASSTSLVFVVAKPTGSWESKIIASVELKLQPCDAKIPFTLPWIDRLERKLASFVGFGNSTKQDLQPYLSNLCVDEKFRGKGLGKDLVHLVENVASKEWGYPRLYLHVDPDNEAAFNLYKSEGYRKVNMKWNPVWAGSSSDISYLVKEL